MCVRTISILLCAIQYFRNYVLNFYFNTRFRIQISIQFYRSQFLDLNRIGYGSIDTKLFLWSRFLFLPGTYRAIQPSGLLSYRRQTTKYFYPMLFFPIFFLYVEPKKHRFRCLFQLMKCLVFCIRGKNLFHAVICFFHYDFKYWIFGTYSQLRGVCFYDSLFYFITV